MLHFHNTRTACWRVLLLLALALGLAGSAGAERPPMPSVVWDVVVRFGVTGCDAPAEFHTADAPDQHLLRATFEGYAGGAQLIRVRTPDGNRLEFYLDPQRSRLFQVDGSACSVDDLVPGEDLVLSASGLEARRVVSRVLRTGSLPAPPPSSQALDPVPVRHPDMGLSLRPPRGWRGTVASGGGVLLSFEPRTNRSRLVPRLIVVRDAPGGATDSTAPIPYEFLAGGEHQAGPATIRETVSAMIVRDQTIMVDVQRISGGARDPLDVVGYALAEDFQGSLAGFRAVAAQIAAP